MRKLTVCNHNIADYTIVLPTCPAPAEQTAADFLRRVIETSCGVTLPISDTASDCGIYIGSRDASDEVKNDGFRITTDDKNVYLDGNIVRGTLYAAYDFAEKYLGYRMFAPDCEVIPTEGETEVPAGLNIVDNPVMVARRTTFYSHRSDPNFGAHCRLNDSMPDQDERWGGHTNITGPCHTMGRLLPASEYFEEHPEYYCLVNGERIPCYDEAGPGQPCLTNPDVLRIMTEKVLKDLREHPDKRVVDVSQTDSDTWCQCEKCQAIYEEEGGPIGAVIRFVNAIAEAVEKEFPKVKIQTFAYGETRFPPKKTSARENVIIRYCTMSACFRHAINDPNCSVNAATRSEIEVWKKHCHHMAIWDYLIEWNCFIAPFPNLISLRENMRYYADCNVGYFLGEGMPITQADGAYHGLKSYLVGKLLWNPYMSEEEYRRHAIEFLEGYYGKGWREIGKYIALEYEATEPNCMLCTDDVDPCFIHYTSAPQLKNLKMYLRRNFVPGAFMPVVPNHPLTGIVERMDEAKGYFDRALTLAETDAEKERIERSRMAIRYLDLFCSEHDELKMSPDEKKAHMEQVEEFYKDKEKYGFHWNLHTCAFRGR